MTDKLPAGIHRDIPMHVYRAQSCAGPSVSGTDLVRVHTRCAMWAFARWSGNPARISEKSTPAQEFGIATHKLIVEGAAAFVEAYPARKPFGLKLNRAAGKEWLAEIGDAVWLPQEDVDEMEAMERMVRAHPLASRLLAMGEPEMTAVWREPETGIWLRVRPDRLLLANKMAINYKTTANASYEPWQRDCLKYGYHLSAALCVDVFAALGRQLKYVHVVQESEPPYIVTVREMSTGFIEHGRIAYQRALRQFADGIATGKFAQYADGVEPVDLPAWAAKQFGLAA